MCVKMLGVCEPVPLCVGCLSSLLIPPPLTRSRSITRPTCVAQIYVGPGPKGDSVAALKRLPRDGGGETVYQLLYCDEKKGTCTSRCIHCKCV